ncbi:hypothetical protein EU408_02015 [Salmonella enterica subsp. enterica]|nr:hypothetical protein [Salmonella enterica subsp. enterica]ECI6608955.1 hypothetical protein [Salmonella enterica subsp. enterica]
MKSITVAAVNTDPLSHEVRRFYNSTDHETVRTTTPDIKQLYPLAAWLVARLPIDVSGRVITAHRVFCYSGITERDRLLSEAKTNAQRQRAEKIIHCYGAALDREERIDWVFPLINPGESDNAYWNRVALNMINSGCVRVGIRNPDEQEMSLTINKVQYFAYCNTGLTTPITKEQDLTKKYTHIYAVEEQFVRCFLEKYGTAPKTHMNTMLPVTVAEALSVGFGSEWIYVYSNSYFE